MTQSEVIANYNPFSTTYSWREWCLLLSYRPRRGEWNSLLQISIVLAVEQHSRSAFRVGEAESTNNVGEFAT